MPDVDTKVMRMASREYVWTIMAEARELFEICADQPGETSLAALADIG